MFDYTDTERYILSKILEMKKAEGVPELKHCVKGAVLSEFQTHMLAFGLVNKKVILSADTGLGKTFLAAGLINVLYYKLQGGKYIVVCPLFNMMQTKKKFEQICFGKSIICVSNAEASLEQLKTLYDSDWDIMLLSYQSLANDIVQKYLINYLNDIKCLIVDESQLLANLSGTASNLVYSMCYAIPYVYLLTATPIRVNVGQFIKQLYMLNPNIFNKPVSAAVRYFTRINEEGKPCGVNHLEELTKTAYCYYINYTRKQLGLKGDYNVEPIIVKNKGLYQDVSRKDIFSKIKGDVPGPAALQLAKTVYAKVQEGKKGLIYINLNETKKKVKSYLEQYGLKVGILDGSITSTQKKKDEQKEKFLNGEYDCMITNLTIGLDLPCDYILFYELTFDFKQMLGRGERGLAAKDLDIIFILVENTEEISYFYENVYLRAKILGLVCNKDVEELEIAYKTFSTSMRGTRSK